MGYGMTDDHADLLAEVATLRTEVERLRSAAVEVIRYEWERTGDRSIADVLARVNKLQQPPWKRLAALVSSDDTKGKK